MVQYVHHRAHQRVRQLHHMDVDVAQRSGCLLIRLAGQCGFRYR
jgi:hypothetical protein